MADVVPFEKEDNKTDFDERARRLLSLRLLKRTESSRSEKFIKVIFTVLFTYVYFVFSSIYLFEYKENLVNIVSSQGWRKLWNSNEFWNFKRDLLIITLVYLLLHMMLKKLMFDRSEE